MYKSFPMEIAAMNNVYQLPKVEHTAAAIRDRAAQFKNILAEELDEIDLIIDESNQLVNSGNMTTADHIRLLTGMGDLLGDLIVFCASEAARYDLPLADVLKLIMQSNFSKLDANGNPIIDPETGKFLKGPNYWKPEPLIAKLLATTTLSFATDLPQDRVVAINMDEVADAARKAVEEVSGTDPTAFPGVNWNADGSPTETNRMMQQLQNVSGTDPNAIAATDLVVNESGRLELAATPEPVAQNLQPDSGSH